MPRYDSRSLEGTRFILTISNNVKLLTDGPKAPGTEVRCLRRNSYGYYIPCMAFVVRVKSSGWFVIDLWEDKSERITVSPKAILWGAA